jgi:hypothetical protein
MIGKTLYALLSLAFLLMAMPQKAAAYVDPGSGAILWQIAAAAVLGSLFRVKRIFGWLRAQLRRERD